MCNGVFSSIYKHRQLYTKHGFVPDMTHWVGCTHTIYTYSKFHQPFEYSGIFDFVLFFSCYWMKGSMSNIICCPIGSIRFTTMQVLSVNHFEGLLDIFTIQFALESKMWVLSSKMFTQLAFGSDF